MTYHFHWCGLASSPHGSKLDIAARVSYVAYGALVKTITYLLLIRPFQTDTLLHIHGELPIDHVMGFFYQLQNTKIHELTRKTRKQ